jgi:hypothetical protein
LAASFASLSYHKCGTIFCLKFDIGISPLFFNNF